MDHWFAADKEEIPDMIADGDVDDIARFLQGDTAALFRIEAIDGKPAEIAAGVANVRDRELEITGPAVLENLFKKSELRFFWRDDGRQNLFLCTLRRAQLIVLQHRRRHIKPPKSAPRQGLCDAGPWS